jgi:hypothetical protein
MFQNIMCGEFGIFVIAIEITDKALKKVPGTVLAPHQIPTDHDPGRKKVKVRIRDTDRDSEPRANLHSLSEFRRR